MESFATIWFDRRSTSAVRSPTSDELGVNSYSFEHPSSNSPGPSGDDIDDAITVATRAREAATTILDQNALSRW